jgi:hypothetical protein
VFVDLRDVLFGVTMSAATLAFATAASRTSIQARRGVSIAQPRLLVASRLSMMTACGLLVASFFFSAPRHPSLVPPVAAAMTFVLGLYLERIRASRIRANTPAADNERP